MVQYDGCLRVLLVKMPALFAIFLTFDQPTGWLLGWLAGCLPSWLMEVFSHFFCCMPVA
jgi:hypothetical protein